MRTISILTLTLLCACGIGCAATVSASIAADGQLTAWIDCSPTTGSPNQLKCFEAANRVCPAGYTVLTVINDHQMAVHCKP